MTSDSIDTATSWSVTAAADRIEELEQQLQVYMNQADDWEVKARNAEADRDGMLAHIDDLEDDLEIAYTYQSWIHRAEGALLAAIAAVVVLLLW